MAGQLLFKLEHEVVYRIRVSKQVLEQNTRKSKLGYIGPEKDAILFFSSFLRCGVEWSGVEVEEYEEAATSD